MSHESVTLRRSFYFDTTVKLQAAYIRFAIRVAFHLASSSSASDLQGGGARVEVSSIPRCRLILLM